MAFFEFTVLVPGAVVAAVDFGAGDLDKADTGFDETAGAETLEAVEPLILVGGVEAVEFFGGVAFLVEIEHVGYGGLHLVGHLVVANGGIDGVVGADGGEELTVFLKDDVELGALEGCGFVGGFDVGDGFAFGLDRHGLMGGGKEAVGEVFEATGRDCARVQEHVAGKVFVFAA